MKKLKDAQLYNDDDIWKAFDILTGYLVDNVPPISDGRYNNWEDWFPELDEARLLIHEHIRFKLDSSITKADETL